MKVLVTGGHLYNGTVQPIREKLTWVKHQAAARNAGVVLIHGVAAGVDTYADAEGRMLGFEIRRYPAAWDLYGSIAGPLRNQEMIDKEHYHKGCAHEQCDGPIDVCLGFPFAYKGTSAGTYDMLERAWKAGIYCDVTEL